ncbi:MAG: LysR family transcriptional regulator [Burkholderiales bacterium]|nr:MAG: LysR family transcriptional regulator [Burkholderiales bacterium]
MSNTVWRHFHLEMRWKSEERKPAMSFRRFRYFVAVAERESFSRAASDLNIAQSALSRHIANLEHTVGARLLERSKHGTRLTPVGRAMFEDARRLLGQAKLLVECHAHAFRPRSGLEVADVFMQLAMVARGVGVAFVNESSRNALPMGVVMRPVRELQISLDVELVWMRIIALPVISVTSR